MESKKSVSISLTNEITVQKQNIHQIKSKTEKVIKDVELEKEVNNNLKYSIKTIKAE